MFDSCDVLAPRRDRSIAAWREARRGKVKREMPLADRRRP
jgi:hypothetical protein